MKKSLLLLLLTITSTSFASPFVISDPITEVVTHCGYILDSNDKVDVPVADTIGGKQCKVDLQGLAVGNHTVKLTFVNIDPVWGRAESVESAPFSLVKPTNVLTVTPSGLLLIK